MKKQVLNEEFKRMQKLAGIIKENMDMDNEIVSAYENSPNTIPWKTIENAYQESGLSGEEFFADFEDEFRDQFEGRPVDKESYFDFYSDRATGGQDNLYTMVNWVGFTNPSLADELYGMI